MKTLSSSAIILGHKNFGESDKIVFLYTEELGKIKTVAKGSRKINSKFTGHLETLNFCKASFYFGPRNIILTEIITLKNFKKIRDNVEKITTALKIAEFTNKVIYENQKVEGVEELISNTLTQLSISNKPQLILHSYIVKLLDKIGLIPDFPSIVTTLEQKYLKYFHFIQNQPMSEIEKISIDETEQKIIDQILEKLVSYSI